MKTASRITLTLAGASVLLAIWQPFGSWWQFLATAVLLLLIGAGTGATADKAQQDDEASEVGSSTGPHQRFTPGGSTTLEQIDQDVAKYKRTYGRSTDR